jgi:hypothetical protein
MAWVSGVPNWAQALACKHISKNKPRMKNACIVIIQDPLANTPTALAVSIFYLQPNLLSICIDPINFCTA